MCRGNEHGPGCKSRVDLPAATAATAVLMVTLVRDHGLQDLLAGTVLAGLIQIGAELVKLGFVMRYVSKSVNLALASPVWLCRSTGKRPVIHSEKGISWR